MLSAYSLDMLIHFIFVPATSTVFSFFFRVYFCSGCTIYNFVKATFDLEKLNGKI